MKLERPFTRGPDFEHLRKVLMRETAEGPVPILELAVDVEVMAEDGEVHTVMAAQWEYKNADQEEVASMTQIPVKLAWALTTHKAQGMTLDPMSCDIADCFEKGQAYVALSRAKRVEGLSLVRKMTFQNVKTCPIAVRFCEELEAVETGGDDR